MRVSRRPADPFVVFTPEEFARDSLECIREAAPTPAVRQFGIVTHSAYRACLRVRGYTRDKQVEPAPLYRGTEQTARGDTGRSMPWPRSASQASSVRSKPAGDLIYCCCVTLGGAVPTRYPQARQDQRPTRRVPRLPG